MKVKGTAIAGRQWGEGAQHEGKGQPFPQPTKSTTVSLHHRIIITGTTSSRQPGHHQLGNKNTLGPKQMQTIDSVGV